MSIITIAQYTSHCFILIFNCTVFLQIIRWPPPPAMSKTWCPQIWENLFTHFGLNIPYLLMYWNGRLQSVISVKESATLHMSRWVAQSSWSKNVNYHEQLWLIFHHLIIWILNYFWRVELWGTDMEKMHYIRNTTVQLLYSNCCKLRWASMVVKQLADKLLLTLYKEAIFLLETLPLTFLDHTHTQIFHISWLCSQTLFQIKVVHIAINSSTQSRHTHAHTYFKELVPICPPRAIAV